MSLKATATINLSTLRHNFDEVSRLVPQARRMAVIKADGYGHGIKAVADTLAQGDGLAVARLEEAETLRQHGIRSRLLVLSEQLTTDTFRFCADRGLDIVVHSAECIPLLQEARLPKPINVWFKHDSGMHRLGLNAADLGKVVRALAQSDNIAQHFYMTHFDSADEAGSERSREQIDAFRCATESLPVAPTSAANSAAIIRGLARHDDWIRPGIMLYGANPLNSSIQAQHPVNLQPVMTLKAPVIAIHTIAAGETVGYNRRWTAQRDSVIATVAAGYGDGYPRHARSGTPVLIGNQHASLAGTVSMDMICVDITDCRGVQIGSEATLWGEGLRAECIAEYAGTIPYQLFTGITSRVKKIYLD